MIQDTERHGTEPHIYRWICSVLESRNIMTTFTGELNDDDCYTPAYADYIAMLINVKVHQTVSKVLQRTLGIVQWCNKTYSSINPNKTAIIPRNYLSSVKHSSYLLRSHTLD
jgi:hypothetical protein